MIFDTSAIATGLILLSLPAIVAAYFHFIKGKQKAAIILLLSSAFLLRLLMISVDPFLHEWDERIHALVAKHMMNNPFKPMLFTKHILPFSKYDVSYTDIWLYKQPLFLWQMAISMKIFGINLIALRLPSAIMGTLMVWLTYDLCRKWWQDNNIAFISAFLSCFAYYALELTSGLMSLDHNDLAFAFYMTCSIWAFTRYVDSGYLLKWAILIGVFAGMAILNKWLVGLLIFGGWGLYLLLSLDFNFRKYLHLILGIIVSCVIFIPWQLYIMEKFPLESSIAYALNKRHMSDDLGQSWDKWFHLRFLHSSYHNVLTFFLLIGIIVSLEGKKSNKKLTISFLAMIFVIFAFFSLSVPTKMPAFVYPVSALMFCFIAVGIDRIINSFSVVTRPLFSYKSLGFIMILLIGLFSLKPWKVIHDRSAENSARKNKIHNSGIFRNFKVAQDYIVLNTRRYENIELMFFRDVLAYHYYPTEHRIDSLQNLGYKFAAFEYPNEIQELPDYIVNDKAILVLPDRMK